MNVTDDAVCTGRGSAALCVLASGSSGNCSVLQFRRDGLRRACLIDLGLSPHRTVRLLAGLGLGLHQIDDVLLTHLDSDHYHSGWRKGLPGHVRLRLHRQHLEFAGHVALPIELAHVFNDEPLTLLSGAGVHPRLMSHDALGVAAFRFDLPPELGAGSLGFATDLGHMTGALIDHFGGGVGPATGGGEHAPGVDVLAIESNYCPRMQQDSCRPEVLKRRIMGGSGHLSNHQAAAAIRRIQPREHVVLLHLSRECNEPAIVSALHEGADYSLTITSQFEPSRWIPIRGVGAGTPRSLREGGRATARVAPTLFEAAGRE